MSTSGIPLKMRNTTGASHTSTRQLCPRRRAMLLNLTSPSLSRKSDFQQPLQESTMARIFTRMDFRSKPESASNMLLGQPRETGEPKSKPKCKQRVAEQRSGSLMLQCQRWKPGPGPSPAQSLPPDFLFELHGAACFVPRSRPQISVRAKSYPCWPRQHLTVNCSRPFTPA